MNSLIRFLSRYQYVLLFLVLEGTSLWLLAANGHYQRAFFGSFVRSISGFVYSQTDKLDQYLELRQSNLNLAAENITLRNEVARLSYALNEYEHSPRIDSLNGVKYKFIKAKLVNNSVNKQHNFLTLNVGKKHGIEPEMGVISNNGVVGIVAAVSENYCTVISAKYRFKDIGKASKNRVFWLTLLGWSKLQTGSAKRHSPTRAVNSWRYCSYKWLLGYISAQHPFGYC